MDSQVNGDHMPQINTEIVRQLVGKVLTIYDAAYAPSASETMSYGYTSSSTSPMSVGNNYKVPSKEDAIKSLITSAIWDWYKSVK